MQQINVILPVAGTDHVGPLPAELQGYIDVGAAKRDNEFSPHVGRDAWELR